MPRRGLVVVVALLASCSGRGDDANDGSTAATTDAGATPDPALAVETDELRLDDVGFVATLAVPDTEGAQPAVMALGGSEGRQPTGVGRLLAEQGYVALSLSYFNAPGLPDDLANIPLEYFETALRWLADRPEVDSDKVFVWGASRGGEAALLIAATYPEPCVSDFTPRYYENHPEAEIPVERIAGPILLTCGRSDGVWESCPNSRAVIDRLEREDHAFDHEMLAYPDAGHLVSVPPDSPLEVDELIPEMGGTTDGNNEARADAWEATLDFLAAASR